MKTELEEAREQAAIAQAENLKLRAAIETTTCSKCGGSGWVWRYELYNSDADTRADSMTKYSCDGDVCVAISQPPSRAALDAYVAERTKVLEEDVQYFKNKSADNYGGMEECIEQLTERDSKIKALLEDLDYHGYMCKQDRAKIAELQAKLEGEEPLSDTYIQRVPDKCDRIVWHNQYIHLPPKAEDAVEDFRRRALEACYNEAGYDCANAIACLPAFEVKGD